MTRPFPARYRGRCAAECGQPIEVDDQVQFVDDELVHHDCADKLGLPGAGRRDPAPCTSCWLVHAGECL